MTSSYPGQPIDPAFRLHAWADESMIDEPGVPGAYVLAAVICDPESCGAVEGTLKNLLRKRQRRLHWHDESDDRRRLLVTAIAGLDLVRVVVVGSPVSRSKQERARRLSLQALLRHLDKLGVTRLTLETRGDVADRRDRDTVVQMQGRHAMSRDLRVRHGSPRDEPMLWVPDVVAGAARLAALGRDIDYLAVLQPVDEVSVVIT